jgi:hypothetical protein
MCRFEVNPVIEMKQDDSPIRDVGRCRDLLESAMPDILAATDFLERLPETLRSDFEGDIRWAALGGLYRAFSKIFRAEQLANRARLTPPAELREVPIFDSDVDSGE